MVNPLKWKPEHRAGLLVGMVAGAMFGIGFGFSRLRAGSYFTSWIEYRSADVFLWALIGAAVCGGGIYCYRVFSN